MHRVSLCGPTPGSLCTYVHDPIRYLREQHPEVRDFSHLRRVPHIEAYIARSAPRPPSLTNDLHILHQR